MTKYMPKEPYQFLSYAPSRSSAAGGDYKVHESVSRAKASVAYHGYGKVYQWKAYTEGPHMVVGWVLLFDVPQQDWRKPKKVIDWDACKVNS